TSLRMYFIHSYYKRFGPKLTEILYIKKHRLGYAFRKVIIFLLWYFHQFDANTVSRLVRYFMVVAASWFIGFRRAYHNNRVIIGCGFSVNETLGATGRGTANRANCI